MTASDPTLAHHVLVETTTFEDQPNARHLCTVCGAESVGEAPPLPCPGPERSILPSRVDAAAGAARVARYAEAIEDALADEYGTFLDGGTPGGVARVAVHRVVAVADEEQAELRAEVERLRGTVARLNRRAQTAEAAVNEMSTGTGRGKSRAVATEMWARCQTVHERGCPRAESAEARLDALVADLRGLADEWVNGPRPALEWNVPIGETFAKSLRAVLADAAPDTATPGEATKPTPNTVEGEDWLHGGSHSRACNAFLHHHGNACDFTCPTCHGGQVKWPGWPDPPAVSSADDKAGE